VGIVFQYPEVQLFAETVYDDIAFGPKNIGLDNIEQRAREAAEFAGISEKLLQKSPFELSGGEQRRAAIAGVIAMDPEILVLDEPSVGLDPYAKKDILNKIREYHEVRQNTVIMVSHDVDIVAEYADKILVLDNGKVVRYGTCEEVFGDVGADSISALPEITKIFRELKNRGYDVSTNVYTIEQAKREIMRKMGNVGTDQCVGPHRNIF